MDIWNIGQMSHVWLATLWIESDQMYVQNQITFLSTKRHFELWFPWEEPASI